MNIKKAKKLASATGKLELWWDFHTREWVLMPLDHISGSDRFASWMIHDMTEAEFMGWVNDAAARSGEPLARA